MYNHIMLEVYCLKDLEENTKKENTDNCSECTPGYSCLENKCPYVTFTSYENALCYVNQNSTCEESIALGEETLSNKKLVSLWKDIACKKINEAYDEFLKQKNKIID